LEFENGDVGNPKLFPSASGLIKPRDPTLQKPWKLQDNN
jgi:hypothetical protein